MSEATPVPAHLAGEMYLWLWFMSERDDTQFKLDAPIGEIHLWVDDRLAFRRPEDTKATAVMTGENPAASLEARAALAGGKVLQELRVGVRRDDREFTFTFKGPEVSVAQLKLPQVLSEAPEEAVVDRMFLVQELHLIVEALIRRFSAVRASSAWGKEVLPAIRHWLTGEA